MTVDPEEYGRKNERYVVSFMGSKPALQNYTSPEPKSRWENR